MIDDNTSRPTTELIEQTMATLSRFDGTYPTAAVDVVLEHREAMTPVLLELLDRVLDEPGRS